MRCAAAEAAVKFKIVDYIRLVALLWTTVRDLRSRVQELEHAQPWTQGLRSALRDFDIVSLQVHKDTQPRLKQVFPFRKWAI